MWKLFGSLVLQDVNVTHQFMIWGPRHTLEHWVPGWYHMNELRLVHHWLVPYEWAVAGPPRCVCHPCVVMFLGVSHELISPKLKRLAFSQRICDTLWNWFWHWIWILDMLWNWFWFWFGLGFGFEESFRIFMKLWLINMFKEIYYMFKARMWTFEWNMLYVCVKYDYGRTISMI